MQPDTINKLNSILPARIAEPFFYSLLCTMIESFWSTGQQGRPQFPTVKTTSDAFYVSNIHNTQTILITKVYGGYFINDYRIVTSIIKCCTDINCLVSIFRMIYQMGNVYGISSQKDNCSSAIRLQDSIKQLCSEADYLVQNCLQMCNVLLNFGLKFKTDLTPGCRSDYLIFYSDYWETIISPDPLIKGKWSSLSYSKASIVTFDEVRAYREYIECALTHMIT